MLFRPHPDAEGECLIGLNGHELVSFTVFKTYVQFGGVVLKLCVDRRPSTIEMIRRPAGTRTA